MLEVNDPVKIMETGEIGYVEEISDEGDRLKVRIPAHLVRWPLILHHTLIKTRHANKVSEGRAK
jgi:hypothetical protein